MSIKLFGPQNLELGFSNYSDSNNSEKSIHGLIQEYIDSRIAPEPELKITVENEYYPVDTFWGFPLEPQVKEYGYEYSSYENPNSKGSEWESDTYEIRQSEDMDEPIYFVRENVEGNNPYFGVLSYDDGMLRILGGSDSNAMSGYEIVVTGPDNNVLVRKILEVENTDLMGEDGENDLEMNYARSVFTPLNTTIHVDYEMIQEMMSNPTQTNYISEIISSLDAVWASEG